MKRVCAWCGAAMGSGEGPADMVTHGICRDCFVEQTSDRGRFVLVVDARVLWELLSSDTAPGHPCPQGYSR